MSNPAGTVTDGRERPNSDPKSDALSPEPPGPAITAVPDHASARRDRERAGSRSPPARPGLNGHGQRRTSVRASESERTAAAGFRAVRICAPRPLLRLDLIALTAPRVPRGPYTYRIAAPSAASMRSAVALRCSSSPLALPAASPLEGRAAVWRAHTRAVKVEHPESAPLGHRVPGGWRNRSHALWPCHRSRCCVIAKQPPRNGAAVG